MFLTFAVIMSLFLIWRTVLPLRCRRIWKILLSLLIVLIALKFDILRLIGGGTFALPALPVWLILLLTWLYSAQFLFFLLILAAELIRLPFRFKFKLSYANRVNLGLLVFTVLLTSYGMWNGTKLPDVRKIEINSSALSDDFKIALLADIHADGKLTKADRIRAIVDAVNREEPDIVLIAGDMVDGSVAACGAELLPLKDLKAKYGVFGIPGNHEYFSGYGNWMKFLAELNIRMLENESVPLTCGFAVAGLTDAAAARYGLPLPDPACIDDKLPTVLMAHRPGLIREVAQKNVILQVSGHTHGGMIYGFDRIVAAFNKGFVSGLYKFDDGKILYVSNGTGIWNGFPVRAGRPSEITIMENDRED